MMLHSRTSDSGRLSLPPGPQEDRFTEFCEGCSCRGEVMQSIIALEKLIVKRVAQLGGR